MGDSVILPVVPQLLEVSSCTEHIDVAVVKETIQPLVGETGIQFVLHEERLDFSSPLVLATPGWPFGPNPNKVTGVVAGVATVVDVVTMPTYYRVVRWLFFVEDAAKGLVITSEIKCMRRGDTVTFMEYAIIGDSGLIPYDVDIVVDGEQVKLVVISRYDEGALTIRTAKIGIFN